MSLKKERVVVMGGGIVGAMCAWELVSAGCQVTVVDRGRFGGACSHGNCGYVSPSHVLPLAQPGAVTSTMKAMMKSNSPFAVKPRMSRDSLRWFWNFARRCNQRDMLIAARGVHELLQSSKILYQELIANERIDCEWQESGLLFVFESARAFEAFARTDKLIRDNFGVAAVPYATRELVEFEPALKPVVAGAWYYDCDCHLRPDKLLAELKRMLEARR